MIVALNRKSRTRPPDCPDFGSRVPRCQRVQERELRSASRDGARVGPPMAGAIRLRKPSQRATVCPSSPLIERAIANVAEKGFPFRRGEPEDRSSRVLAITQPDVLS